jgi:hypothetical protein
VSSLIIDAFHLKFPLLGHGTYIGAGGEAFSELTTGIAQQVLTAG